MRGGGRPTPGRRYTVLQMRRKWRRKVVKMSKQVIAKTGHPAPRSGQYRPSGSTREITLSRGDTTPPNNFGVRHKFYLVDETKHKGK